MSTYIHTTPVVSFVARDVLKAQEHRFSSLPTMYYVGALGFLSANEILDKRFATAKIGSLHHRT